MNRIHASFFLIFIVITFPAFLETAHAQEKTSPFDMVMQRAGDISAKTNWRLDGWKDIELESSLSLLMKKIQAITKNKNITLPVSFDSVNPSFDNGHLKNSLVVTKLGKISHAKDSIIIADENIKVSHAQNCLIIARGAVDVSHGSQNVIIAGHYIHVSHDGNSRRKATEGLDVSILLSGSVVDVSHAKKTIVCAPVAAKISHARDVTFINSPNLNLSRDQNSIHLIDDSSILPDNSEKDEWIDTLTITQVVPPGSRQQALVVVNNTGSEMLMRLGDTIPQAKGKQIGWKLVFVSNEFVMLKKNGNYASANIVQNKLN